MHVIIIRQLEFWDFHNVHVATDNLYQKITRKLKYFSAHSIGINIVRVIFIVIV